MQRRGIVSHRPTQKHRLQAGRVASARRGTVASQSPRQQLSRGVLGCWPALQVGTEQNLAQSREKKWRFLSTLIPLIAPCCSQPSPTRTGSLLSGSKASSSPFPSSAHALKSPSPTLTKHQPRPTLDQRLSARFPKPNNTRRHLGQQCLLGCLSRLFWFQCLCVCVCARTGSCVCTRTYHTVDFLK